MGPQRVQSNRLWGPRRAAADRASHSRIGFPAGLPSIYGRCTAAGSSSPIQAGASARRSYTGLDIDIKLFATVFSTVFVAELGDKTQLASLLYASEASHPKLTVFAASAAALVLTSALAVLAGSLVADYVSPKVVRWVAGLGFIAVGIWVLATSE